MTEPLDELDRIALRRFSWAYRASIFVGVAICVTLSILFVRWVPDRAANAVLTLLVFLLVAVSMFLGMIAMERLHIRADARRHAEP